MAKKSRARARASRSQYAPSRAVVVQRRWRLKLIVGGAILVLALGVGLLARYLQARSLQERDVAPRLQEKARETRYTRGPAGAPVVIKEFSDYT
ncbi:MAG: hypothetical protein FJZ47_11690 [Candidatus Tectomicrobia bacterium]|uniref:Uncharacterized protein n=1 Tax=Tectimicrobiota bacterium TaxID=2528274 RepID=A0A937W087_UNCTE|nr:hypothetical protein [Candidatus Tectomicrobia bacterium]